MLTRREGKYTSASPRCTCLPPRQHCAGVALGSPPPTPQHCWFGRRTSTTRLRLVVLASSSSTMLWSCTRWTSDSNAMLILRKDKYTSAAPLCTCLPPHPTLNWSCTRRKASTPRLRLGVLAFLLVQLQLKSTAAKSRYNSASPRCTWTWPWWTWAESVVDYLVQLQLKSSRSSWSPTRLRLVGLQLDLDDFSQSLWSTPPLLCDLY